PTGSRRCGLGWRRCATPEAPRYAARSSGLLDERGSSVLLLRAHPDAGDRHRDRTTRVGEEVVALLVDHDEGGEVLDLDLPDRLHAEFGVLQHLLALDAVQG